MPQHTSHRKQSITDNPRRGFSVFLLLPLVALSVVLIIAVLFVADPLSFSGGDVYVQTVPETGTEDPFSNEEVTGGDTGTSQGVTNEEVVGIQDEAPIGSEGPGAPPAPSLLRHLTNLVTPQYEAPPSAQPPAPDSSKVVPSGFGMSLSSSLYPLTDAALAARLDDLASLGVTWIRIDMAWTEVERAEGAYVWGPIDRVVAAARKRNIQVLGLLLDPPWWARVEGCNDHHCAPRDVDAFARYAGKAAARYAPQGVHAWEIWNEPNIELFWKPAPSPEAYATLLIAAHTAIKKADGSAVVISGGLSPAETRGTRIAPTDFLTALYNAGAGDAFDAVGHHPYSYPATPNVYHDWSAWSQMAKTRINVRSVMAGHGDSTKKIWMTEYGAPTNGPRSTATLENYKTAPGGSPVSEEVQALMLKEAVEGTTGVTWAGPLFWYSYKDNGTASWTVENFFGITRSDGSHKPAYETLRSLLGS